MEKKTKITLYIVTALVLAAAIAVAVWLHLRPVEEEPYQPVEEFQPAYERLTEEHESEEYDIEQTVRIINGMELAQSQSADFVSYMEYLARQDYSEVPQEVIDAKRELLPILQRLFLLEKQQEDLHLWTDLVRRLANGLFEDSQDAYSLDGDDNATERHALELIMGLDPTTIIGIEAIGGLGRMTDYVFEKYQEEQRLKGEVAREIEEIRMQYIDYQEQFTPVYIKYMKEWDQLCLKKDRMYLYVDAGQFSEAYNTADQILSDYPRCREALLLKAMALMGMAEQHTTLRPVEMQERPDSVREARLLEAQVTLEQYMDLYPDRSAPALLLRGQMLLMRGQQAEAFIYLDQASMEYIRQAAALTDMLDSYRFRTYLTHTEEGVRLLRMYESTMEGFGMFSPNLLKARYYEQQGNYDLSREAIFSHFFRRSNQQVYDCLVSDMEYCEDNLYTSFRQLLPESGYIDVLLSPSTRLLGLKEEATKLDVEVSNRADRDLENVRIFLCVHYTDMHPDDYHVVKVPTLSRVVAGGRAGQEAVDVAYQDKTLADITRVRAIAMTDNSICWVDNVMNTAQALDYNARHHQDWENLTASLDSAKRESMDAYLETVHQNAAHIVDAIYRSPLSLTRVSKGLRKQTMLTIDLPRVVSLFNPVFSLDGTTAPTVNCIRGSYVHLEIPVDNTDAVSHTLYMGSDYLPCTIHISSDGTTARIQRVEPSL